MRNFVKRSWVSGAILSVALCLASPANSVAQSDDGLGSPVVAKGKGIEIKRSDIEDAFIFYRANIAASGGRIFEDERERIEADLFNQMLLSKMLLSRATAEDKAKAKELADKKITEVKSLFSSENIFKWRLKALGLTVEKFEQQTLDDELRKIVLRREVGSKLTVSDAAIKKFYDENAKNFERPGAARARHILLLTIDSDTRQPLSPEKKAEKLVLGKQLKARADKGEDFAKLAKEFSEDPSQRGGGVEYAFTRGELLKPFEEAVFAMRDGQISDPVETQHGYYVIKLIEKVPAKTETLEEATPKIRSLLLDNEIRKNLPEFYEKLKKENGVEILDQKLANTSKSVLEEKK